jgi:hypothetical protein
MRQQPNSSNAIVENPWAGALIPKFLDRIGILSRAIYQSIIKSIF